MFGRTNLRFKTRIELMPTETRIVAHGPDDRSVRTADGQTMQVPEGWELLPPGDATLTRRVKVSGPSWTVQEKKGWPKHIFAWLVPRCE